MADKADVVLIGVPKKLIVDGLKDVFTLHIADHSTKAEPLLANVGSRIRGAAITGAPEGRMNGAMMALCPKLEFVSSFGVGYDNIDIKHSVEHGIVVCNTPEVLNEEVADTALGLLLCTVREFPKAENFLRAGKWMQGQYPLTKATLRDRKVGVAGMGRIGKAIARRLEGFGVPVVYHSRNPQAGVSYKYYPKLLDMARDVDTLMVIVPGGASTQNLINAEVLKALGPNGILINMARGSVVDEPALIQALKDRTLYSAGLDVFVKEPEVPKELREMEHVVLFPHLGSASEATRAAMDQLVVDNIVAWASGKPPLTPVPETPYPPKK
jgi:lactate dehydrogenase-like 2-hydroxyacid dehydrogenase